MGSNPTPSAKLTQPIRATVALKEGNKTPGPNEVAEIEQMPAKIDAALNLREDADPGES